MRRLEKLEYSVGNSFCLDSPSRGPRRFTLSEAFTVLKNSLNRTRNSHFPGPSEDTNVRLCRTSDYPQSSRQSSKILSVYPQKGSKHEGTPDPPFLFTPALNHLRYRAISPFCQCIFLTWFLQHHRPDNEYPVLFGLPKSKSYRVKRGLPFHRHV